MYAGDRRATVPAQTHVPGRLERTADLLYASLYLLMLAAILLGLAHITRFRSLPEEERNIGLSGSVKGRLFTAPFAAGHFSVGASGSLRLNLDNFSEETYQLILRSVPADADAPVRYTVAPGLTKLRLKPGRGPAYIEFRWNRTPAGVVLNTVQASEFRRFRHLMRAVLIIALVAALLYFLSGVRERSRGTRRAGFCVFFLFFAAYFQIFDDALIPLTGDEPHYLVLSESLLRDGDLRVEDNYDSVWRNLYYPDEIDHHVTPTADGLVASHYPLLSVVLAPAMLGAAFGFQVDPYATGKLIMVLLAALTAGFVFTRVIRRTRRGAPRMAAGLFSLLAFASMPFLAYSNQLFPELLAGLLLFLITSALYDRTLRSSPFHRGSTVRLLPTYLLVLPVALLPWANLKFAPAALFCGLYLLWVSRNSPRQLWITGGLLAMGALAIALFTFTNYGELLGPYATKEIATDQFFTRYATYLFDADRGIFALVPLLFWALPGLFLFWRRSPLFTALLFALIMIGHLPNLLQADARDWLLGYCPAGRYWIAVFPLLVWMGARGIAAMARWPRHNRVVNGLRVATLALTVPGAALALAQSTAFLADQQAYYLPLRQTGNAARFLLETYHIDITRVFAYAPFTDIAGLLTWITVCLLFLGLGLSISRRRWRRTGA